MPSSTLPATRIDAGRNISVTPQQFATARHDPLEPKRRLPPGSVFAFVGISGILVFLVGSCSVLLANLSLGFGIESKPRVHLRPIPVPHKVCPYVRVMHSAADDFQHVNPLASLDVALLTSPWPTQQAHLEQSLNVLEFSVVASKAQFPAPIQRRFTIVLTKIRSGRADLRQSTSAFDLMDRTRGTFDTGQVAFGEASDLIGNECDVHLAADPVTVSSIR